MLWHEAIWPFGDEAEEICSIMVELVVRWSEKTDSGCEALRTNLSSVVTQPDKTLFVHSPPSVSPTHKFTRRQQRDNLYCPPATAQQHHRSDAGARLNATRNALQTANQPSPTLFWIFFKNNSLVMQLCLATLSCSELCRLWVKTAEQSPIVCLCAVRCEATGSITARLETNCIFFSKKSNWKWNDSWRLWHVGRAAFHLRVSACRAAPEFMCSHVCLQCSSSGNKTGFCLQRFPAVCHSELWINWTSQV